MDFITWAICLPRWILKCRTAFGFAVRRSFTAVGGAPSLPTVAFPLPLPHPGVWLGGGPGLSKRRFKRLAMKRLLNLVVLALDLQYLGRAPTVEEIGRCPNQWHLRCYDRLRTLLAACGTDPEPFPLAPGRSGPELGACLFQLEQFLAKPLLLERGYRERLGTDFVDDPSIFPGEPSMWQCSIQWLGECPQLCQWRAPPKLSWIEGSVGPTTWRGLVGMAVIGSWAISSTK